MHFRQVNYIRGLMIVRDSVFNGTDEEAISS